MPTHIHPPHAQAHLALPSSSLARKPHGNTHKIKHGHTPTPQVHMTMFACSGSARAQEP